MDLDLSPEQAALRDAIARIVADTGDIPREGGVVPARTWIAAEAMERAFEAGGFFGIALEPGCGAVEAALLVEEAGRSPLALECAGSALIGPLLTGALLPRPVAVARLTDLTRGVRFLDQARTLVVLLDDDVAVLPVEGLEVIALTGPYAYPLGKLAAVPDLAVARRLGHGAVPELQRLWRLALALEAAAAMQATIDFTTEYVKQRQVFSRPVGSFQAVQHRLSIDAVRARGVHWLAMKAAWSGSPLDAALAALHAQRSLTQVVYDGHQFNGALGMTLEHALHYWTFRLRWLGGELGGWSAQAAAAADMAWPNAAT